MDVVRVLFRAKANALLAATMSCVKIVPLDAAALGGHVTVVRELAGDRRLWRCK